MHTLRLMTRRRIGPPRAVDDAPIRRARLHVVGRGVKVSVVQTFRRDDAFLAAQQANLQIVGERRPHEKLAESGAAIRSAGRQDAFRRMRKRFDFAAMRHR